MYLKFVSDAHPVHAGDVTFLVKVISPPTIHHGIYRYHLFVSNLLTTIELCRQATVADKQSQQIWGTSHIDFL